MTEGKMEIGAATADEVLLTYSDSKAPHDLACVGHLRMHFGGSGTEFQSSWFAHQEVLNTAAFREELQDTIEWLRSDLLLTRADMQSYLAVHEGAEVERCGSSGKVFRTETDHNVFYLRCVPAKGDYDCYCYCYNKEMLEQALAIEQVQEQREELQMGGVST